MGKVDDTKPLLDLSHLGHDVLETALAKQQVFLLAPARRNCRRDRPGLSAIAHSFVFATATHGARLPLAANSS